MQKLVLVACYLFSFSVFGNECVQKCEQRYTNSLFGCQYMQQTCIRRHHREEDMEYCMQQTNDCVEHAQTQKSACELICAETNCGTTCNSTGMYNMSRADGMFGTRCYEIVDCAIQSWDEQAKQCILNRHEERRIFISCTHIPPA